MHDKKSVQQPDEESVLTPTYASREMTETIPKRRFPQRSTAPATVYNLIHDELILDGNSRQNLATFVTTWMEPEAKTLMSECFDKNMIDKDEYPQTAEIESRCVNMLSTLWHSPDHETATGTSTVGSSEAAMLGGMAMKWNWRAKMKKAGKATDKPNLVMGANTQICWHKFCRYWDIEAREVTSEGDRFTLNAEEALKLVDENTIGMIVIMGSTMDGSYEPVKEVAEALDKYQRDTGIDIPVHVDGASGAFIAPFLQPELEWDFRVPRVVSINASGHKYGLVYPGVGWILWRDKVHLPEDLVFHVTYLGGDMIDFSINFSRPGNQVVAQYYNFLRLGMEGYQRIQQACQDVALYLSAEIARLGPFELITDGSDIPVFCWKMTEAASNAANYTLFDMADKLRERGWLVPAYPMPKNRQDLIVQRVVVKEGFSRDMADMLLQDMRNAIQWFKSQPGFIGKEKGGNFRH
ncbi:MAG: glutamate decarboxylase [Gammaproteobacteria bacterium]|nr:MAG: glutamate decarboxylase [Gammaproteobacteria bacterium]